MYFVASAPRIGKHVNVSPKGMPSSTFTIFDPNRCAYVDATGSGAETIAHIYENGRVTLCWCSFDTTPRILRFYCWGRVIEHDSPEFLPTIDRMGHQRVNGARAIILLDVWKVGTSCGMAVPLLEMPQEKGAEVNNDSSKPMKTQAARHFEERESLNLMSARMEESGKILPYRQEKNTTSLDGLPGLRVARAAKGHWPFMDKSRTLIRQTLGEIRGIVVGALLTLLAMFVFKAALSSGVEKL